MYYKEWEVVMFHLFAETYKTIDGASDLTDGEHYTYLKQNNT
jgi:hypothetical protein